VTHADQIHVFEGGQIIETGNHQTLLQRDGRYAHMWRVQQAEQGVSSESPASL